MRYQEVSPSRLPSLLVPCPLCVHRMVITAVEPALLADRAASSDLEDITHCCAQCGMTITRPPPLDVRAGDDEVLVWMRGSDAAPRRVKPKAPHQVHKRHTRKYAEGSLGEDRSFYFRGPDDALNLRAQNLVLFIQISGGVDDLTWMHHLRRGD
jgi:hypothetical protein